MKRFISYFIVLFISAGLFAQTDILPPVLVSPTDGDDDQMPDVTMDWYAVSGIGEVTYELELDLDSLFGTAMQTTSSFTSYDATELLFDTVYYWRVRAIDDEGTSDWSETFSFRTFVVLTLDEPGDGDDGITPEAELEWKVKYGGKAMSGITHYDYEVSFDTMFTDIYIEGSLDYVTPGANSTDVAVVTQLYFDTTYFWRVKAVHDLDETEWTEAWSFNTMDMVEHVGPADEATDQMLDVTVEWDDITGASEYIYAICDDPTFNSPCIFFSEENSIIPFGLLFGTTYYWKVQAAHTVDTSAWSEAWSFETMNHVDLVSPEDGGYVDDLFPTMTWEEVTGVSGFELKYDSDENFSDPIVEMVEGDKHSHKVLYAMEMDETYYWQIRAYENGDTTEWSEVWSFIVGVDGINDILSESNVSIYPNPASSDLFVKINSGNNEEVTVSVLSLLGQVILSEELNLGSGSNSKQIDLEGIENGLYIVRLQSGNATFSQKFVIDK